KFWVYEKGIAAPYYGIHDVQTDRLELYHLDNAAYQLVPANARGHFPIPEMGVELGIWHGLFGNVDMPWLRWWDDRGNLLPTPEEQLAQERLEKERALEQANRLAEQLRALGVSPDL